MKMLGFINSVIALNLYAGVLYAAPECATLDECRSAISFADGVGKAKVIYSLKKFGKSSVPVLVQLLKDDEAVCANAAITLGEIGPDSIDALPELVRLLKDDTSSSLVKHNVAVAIGMIGPQAKDAIPALEEQLQNTNRDVRLSACKSLGRMGEQSVPSMVRALSLKDPLLHAPILESLGSLGVQAKEAVPAILNDDTPGVHLGNSNAFALVKIGTVTIPTLLDALRAESCPAANIAAKAFAFEQFHNPETFTALKNALKTQNSCLTKDVLFSLGSFKESASDIVPELIPLFANPKLRETLAVVVGAFHDGGRDAVPQLREMLGLNEADYGEDLPYQLYIDRLAAIAALGEIGAPAEPAVRDLIKVQVIPEWDEWKYVFRDTGKNHSTGRETIIKSARLAIKKIGAAAAPEIIKAIRESTNLERYIASEAILTLGKDAILVKPDIINLLSTIQKNDGNVFVARNLLETIGTFGLEARDAAPALVSMTLDDANAQDIASTLVFIQADPKIAVPFIVNIIRARPDHTNGCSIISLLGEYGPAAASSVADLETIAKYNSKLGPCATNAISKIVGKSEKVLAPGRTSGSVDLPKKNQSSSVGGRAEKKTSSSPDVEAFVKRAYLASVKGDYATVWAGMSDNFKAKYQHSYSAFQEARKKSDLEILSRHGEKAIPDSININKVVSIGAGRYLVVAVLKGNGTCVVTTSKVVTVGTEFKTDSEHADGCR